jgi:hypothetical protein
MSLLLSGSIPLNGCQRAEVTSPLVTATSRVSLKGASAPINGTIVISEMTPGVGFALSSTSADDVNIIIYFDVLD